MLFFADRTLFDFLHRRLREGVELVDESGHITKGTTSEPILQLEHVSTLYLIVALIVENGGSEITLTEHGSPGRDLPFVELSSLSQLRRKGWITTRRDGTSLRVGLGPRARKIAARWKITLPAAPSGGSPD